MRLSINLKVPNTANIIDGLSTVINNTGQQATQLVANTAIDKAPRHFGTLKRSIYPQVNATVGKFTGKVIQDATVAPYGKYVEQGTGIYGPYGSPIVPVTKPFLAWKDYGGGWHRAKSVKGQKAQPFMEPAISENQDNIKQMFNVNITQFLNGLGSD